MGKIYISSLKKKKWRFKKTPRHIGALLLFTFLTVFTAGKAQNLVQSGFTSVITPLYMSSGTATRLPVMYRATVSGLTANTVYRFYTQGATNTATGGGSVDFGTTNPGAGNPLLISPGGTSFSYTTGPSLTTAGNYQTFTADASGNYTGWFGFVNTGNARFTAGNLIYPSIVIGSNTGTVLFRRALDVPITVLAFAATNAATAGTFLKETASLATAKNMVAIYDNTSGSGRPLFISPVESIGVAIASTIAGYGTTGGSWNAIIPNANANGVKRAEQRSIIDGTVTGCATDDDGVWPTGSVNTVNPVAGAAGLAIAAADAPLNSCIVCNTITVTASAPAIACPGGTTTVTVAATGGTAPYTGTGNFTVSAGTYTYNITDANGCPGTTNIVVGAGIDSINPGITAPDTIRITIPADSTSATGVNLGTATTSDNCSVASVTNNAPASFPLGTTIVIWTVTDQSGNTSTDSQAVIVTAAVNPSPDFTLQLLHASDFESNGSFAPNFAAIVDTLEGQYPNTVLLSSGDNWIPSPFYNASSDRPAVDPVLRNVYNQFFGANTSNFLRAASGRVDISILNILGFQASVLGNHEFDAGTSAISDIIGYEISGSEIRWMGAQFPFLSANLNFGNDALLSPLFTSQVLPNTDYISRPDTLKSTSPRRKIAPSTIINVNGQQIGIVGATTQILESISSTGGVTVKGSKTNNMAELATFIQPIIDSLTAKGINKIILLSHLQQIAFEKQLVGLLRDVDVIVAGGSSTLLSDGNDVLRAGDISAGGYPFVSQNANGQPALVVNTDQEYKYVGRLVLTFDSTGVIRLSSLDSLINGVYATTDQTVTNLWGNLGNAFAVGTKGNRVKTLVDGVNSVIIAQDGNIIGKTNVYLEGRRIDVRTQETNLGNLSADANTAAGKILDPAVQVSIKNGGGIRTSIGEIRVNPTTNILEELPPQANPLSGKQLGEVSQLDVANSLRFNNSLSLVTVTAAQLLRVLNHGVAAIAPGATPGQFAQVGGVKFSFDPSLPAGSRVRNAAIIDSTGNVVEVLARNGIVQGDSLRPIRVVTLTFLVTGGDNYPFNSFIAANPAFANRIDLVIAGAPRTGNFTFADDGSEQDAFAEYLNEKYAVTPYNELDTEIPQDNRIQNLSLRGDSVLPNEAPVVSITSPVSPATYNAGSTISIQAAATDIDGSVTKVELFANGVLFATDSTAPYTFTGSNVEEGIYNVLAKATDNTGLFSVTDTLQITVTGCTPVGFITGEGYTNIPGTQVADLTANAAYPNNPSINALLNTFEYANVGNNYGARVRGYICAPATGNYTFYVAGDEQAGLWLSTDENPANKILIAYNETTVGFRQYYIFPTQKSVTIPLVKGARYYIETLHKQGPGGDHLSVAWVLPNGTLEAPIAGNRLSPVSAPAGARVAQDFSAAMQNANLNLAAFKVTATPNPSANYFSITTRSSNDKMLTVTLTDVLGRVLEKRMNIAANGTLQLGNNLRSGIYFVEVTQGSQKQKLRLVKQ